MKVLVIEWDSYGNIMPALKRREYQLLTQKWNTKAEGIELEKQSAMFMQKLAENPDVDYVFSFNYYPPISEICQKKMVRYVSWIYDSPYYQLYDQTISNSVNYIFIFDYAIYQRFAACDIGTVHYLPLAVDACRLEQICGPCGVNVPGSKHYRFSYLNLPSGRVKLDADVAFVGSLYLEPKHRLYDRFQKMNPFAKGYLDAIVQAQKQIYGDYMLERLLTEDIIQEMEKVYPTQITDENYMTPAQIYGEFALCRQVTSLERSEILAQIGRLFGEKELKLYTIDHTSKLEGWKNMGPIDYYEEMPQVFRSSRINLNITLKSIFTGIPLRAFDIMGAGGFLLSNYQPELFDYFVPDEDFVYYTSYDDLMSKIEYYLSHEDERRQIAENGCRKVREQHTFDRRLDEIEKILFAF